MINLIKAPIEKELESYEEFTRKAIRSEEPFLNSILDYVFENKGKSLRPMLVLLSAGMHSASPAAGLGKRAYLAAMLVEMIHTASLIHDDVIDESDTRRGHPSVNARWKSRNAVLTGDYILARNMQAGLESGQYDLLTYVSRAMGELCEGELSQSDHSARVEMTRRDYTDIIYKKTAVLIGSAAALGALAVGAGNEAVSRMRRFGDYLGMAFQIKDDILDYTGIDIGKPVGNDLREKKITLPLLALLEKCGPERREQLTALLRETDTHPENIETLRRTVIEEGGIETARQVMQEYVQKAVALLADYPHSHYRTSLATLCSYVAEREK